MTHRLPSTVRAGRRVTELEDRLIVARAARDAAIRDRHRQGIGPTQIAREVGITRQAVYNVLVNQLDPDRSVV